MRIERDSMGEMPVPDDALYGASTQRAVLNFPISGHPMPPGFIAASLWSSWRGATANEELGLLSRKRPPDLQVAQEIVDGGLATSFQSMFSRPARAPRRT